MDFLIDFKLTRRHQIVLIFNFVKQIRSSCLLTSFCIVATCSNPLENAVERFSTFYAVFIQYEKGA